MSPKSDGPLVRGNSDRVNIRRNPDGTHTAISYGNHFTGTYAECMDWLRGNGKTIVEEKTKT